MKLPVLVIRPDPGGAATYIAATARGLVAENFALFRIAPRAWDAPAADSFDALLLGSANALRHGGAALVGWQGKPAWCVGAATARAAQAVGLSLAGTGEGGLQTLLNTIPPCRLLRLAGAERVALTPPPGVELAERITYASEPLPLPDALARLLLTQALPGFVLLLHSAEAARHFIAETDRLHIPRSRIHAIAIGPRVVAAAQAGGWASLAAAPAPTDEAMLALAEKTCQNGPA